MEDFNKTFNNSEAILIIFIIFQTILWYFKQFLLYVFQTIYNQRMFWIDITYNLKQFFRSNSAILIDDDLKIFNKLFSSSQRHFYILYSFYGILNALNDFNTRSAILNNFNYFLCYFKPFFLHFEFINILSHFITFITSISNFCESKNLFFLKMLNYLSGRRNCCQTSILTFMSFSFLFAENFRKNYLPTYFYEYHPVY